MKLTRSSASLMPVVVALGLSACGDDNANDPASSSTGTGSAASVSCPDVQVPGHEAVMVRAQGADCDAAKTVAAAAEGRGRAPYEQDGFACEGEPADAGDTTYTCTKDAARITFLYGTT